MMLSFSTCSVAVCFLLFSSIGAPSACLPAALLLPAVHALVIPPTNAAVTGIKRASIERNLSRLESLLLRNRLENIRNQVEEKARRQLPPLLKLDGNNDDKGNRGTRELDVTIIFPGADGRDMLSDELEERLREKDASAATTTFDWNEHRGSILTAAYDSEAVGVTVGQTLWDLVKRHNDNVGGGGDGSSSKVTIRSVHCVGISVGAFAANGAVAHLCRLRSGDAEDQVQPPSPYLRLTLLDPFTSRGVLGTSYGPNNFGRYGDEVTQILNTDDPVPTTNKPLPKCVCYDVTHAKVREDFDLPEGETMHCWPVAYYARYGLEKEMEEKTKGTVVRVE